MDFTPTDESGFEAASVWAEFSQTPDFPTQDYYFQSYAHYSIHEDMIKDSVRTGAYKNAILRNTYLFRDKVVLDVGCGTGILSFFALKAGARRVYAVDCSDVIDFAKKFAEVNGFADRVVFIKGKVEEVEVPEEVDILISEWMGYFLLYESMLDSVLFARDKWLKPDGLMFPDKARLWVTAIEDAKYKEDKIEFWHDVYGINMISMRGQSLREPMVDTIDHTCLFASYCPILDINLQTVTPDQLEFTSTYKIQAAKANTAHALVVWFEVGFFHCHKPVILTTAPNRPETHWKQVLLYFDTDHVVEANDEMEGSVAVRRNLTQKRELDIKVSFNVKGTNPSRSLQFYRLR